MKNIILIILFAYLISLGCTRKIYILKLDTFFVTKMEGDSQDAKKVFYKLKEDISPQKNRIYLRGHIKSWYDLYVLSDTFLAAHYNIEKSDSGIFINNYSIVRPWVSYNDTNERRYRVTIQRKTLRKVVVCLTNTNCLHALNKPIVFTLEHRKVRSSTIDLPMPVKKN